jgi:uroporphyrinogen decarboxylase
MTPRNLVIKTLTFDSPPRIPRHLWLLPWAEKRYPSEAASIRLQFPDDIIQAPAVYDRPLGLTGRKYTAGVYIDEWGCRFVNMEDGLMGIVHEPLIRDWSDLDHFQPPAAVLDIDREAINRFCRSTDRFVYAGSIVRPLERFQFLRTMEQSMVDVMLEEPGFTELLRRMHEHFCKEVDAWASTDVDAVFLMDDWGTQHGMMLSPEVFRKHFKPMYKDYCEIARQHGKFVFMHSDGNIADILPELAEVGVHALNSQLFCMDIDRLSREMAGKITFWGEIDRQDILPNGTRADICEAVNLVYSRLHRNGGVIAQCEFGPAAKPENIRNVFECWDEISVTRDARGS